MTDRAALLERAAATAQVLVDDLDKPTPDDADIEHLSRSLRLRPNEAVIATDGRGAWRVCRWASSEELEADGDLKREERSEVRLTVGFSLLKGDRSEWVVQKLTELGVDVIMPLQAHHSIVRWGDQKARRNVERFRRVAYEAAMQSRRVWLPEITEVQPLAEAMGKSSVLAHPGGEPLSLRQPSVMVGPEGGWSPDELSLAHSTVDLGPTILRAETAAITTGGLMCALRANSVKFR